MATSTQGMIEKQPWIETPLIWSRRLSKLSGCNIYLKLENTQPSGSFKSRGMGAFVRAHLLKNKSHGDGQTTHFFCSSGGNAGLGCVSAAVTYGCPATIIVPESTSEYMITKIKNAGATEVVQTGASWYEANQYLLEKALPAAQNRGENAVYVPPFDDPHVWAGHSTMVDEIVRQLATVDKHYPSNVEISKKASNVSTEIPDAVVCSVGGGGLFNGLMQGLERHSAWQEKNDLKVLAVETVGADSLSKSVQQGELITLPGITSIATTLGARRVCEQSFKYAMDKERVQCAVLTDKETVQACKQFAEDERILVEPACAVSLAVLYTGKLKEFLPHLQPDSRVVVVVCGGSGLSVDILNKYIKDYLE